MKPIFTLLAGMSLLILSFVSCAPKDEATKFRDDNEQYFNSLMDSKEYEVHRVTDSLVDGEILIKRIANGPAEGVAPTLTSTVSVHYKGKDKDGVIFDQSFAGDEPISTDEPLDCRPNQLIKGFAQTIVKMVPGDRCEVVIPWDLAYGEKGFDTLIKPYSTLHFEIILVKVL